MKNPKFAAYSTAILCGVALAPVQTSAAEKLSDILQRHGWEEIVGKWVDAETKGNVYTVNYSWKIKDRVIEVATKGREMTTVGLMGVNAKTGEVFHMGADSTGGSSLGQWDIDDNGDAILGLLFTGADGEQGALSIRHRLEGKDTLIATVELPEPITLKLTRVKPAK